MTVISYSSERYFILSVKKDLTVDGDGVMYTSAFIVTTCKILSDNIDSVLLF